MGYILDECPTVHQCCCFIPLRAGVVIVGLLGIVCSAFFIFGFTMQGIDVIVQYGLAAALVKPLRYFNGICGVLLIAVHLLLLCGASYESDALCEVYIWFMVTFWTISSLAAALVCTIAVLDGEFLLSCATLAALLVLLLVSFYFTLVVANYRMTLP